MPHVIVDHSAALARSHDLAGLCEALYRALAEDDAVPRPEALKIRTLAAGAHRLGSEPQSYAHATLLLLPGRAPEARAHLTELILSVMEGALADVGSLSVNVADLDPAYAKRVL